VRLGRPRGGRADPRQRPCAGPRNVPTTGPHIDKENRSLALNSELSFSLSDQRIVAELEEHFRGDLELSNEIDLESWGDRPLRKRLVERAISPIRDMF